ncbi:MAG TPA: hypothetical protein DIC53_00425 [Synergistaceae bacterium]|jgi:tetratricopeptide (TPR) repeat protein|nr:hypothetical protein [Synergistaceae bacterium]
MTDMDRVEELLDRLYGAEDDEETEQLAREVLALDDDNVEGLMLLADVVPYSEEKIGLLERAKGILEADSDDIPSLDTSDPEEQERCSLYMAVLQRLGFAYFSEGRHEDALDLTIGLLDLDVDGLTLARSLYYRILIEMKRDRDVLEATMNDAERSASMLHSKAIALWRLSGPGDDAYMALWEAFRAAPLVPFYILGYFDEPDEEDVDRTEEYNLALFFEDAWSSETGLLNWLAQGTILLGLAASLFPREDTEKMMILADALHIADSVEDAMVRLESRQDWAARTTDERIDAAVALFVQGRYLPRDES